MNMHIRFDPLDLAVANGNSTQAGRIVAKWHTLHRAAAVVAALVTPSGDAGNTAMPSPPQDVDAFEAWRSAQLEQNLDDLVAMMEPGIAALTTLHRRGADCSTAARALISEFNAARDALLRLMPRAPGETQD